MGGGSGGCPGGVRGVSGGCPGYVAEKFQERCANLIETLYHKKIATFRYFLEENRYFSKNSDFFMV